MEFQKFKKIPRLSREIVITEKIDGTNGVIYIGSLEFSVGEFKDSITPEVLIQAIKARSVIDVPVALTSIESLNKLLEYKDLYKVMKERPDEAKALISRLEEGEQLSLLETIRLNRLLMEANYPLETPKSLYIGEAEEFLIGSHSRWLGEHTDNHNFWHWAMNNKSELLKLGPGFHYGEWWGSGVQRGYGLPKGEKRFSLFNVGRWCLFAETPKLISIDPKTKIEKYQERLPSCCGLVPILWTGMFETDLIDGQLNILETYGSKASPGFMNPEGIVIYHKAGNLMFKKTIKKDEERKNSLV